jgi:hypothetical protein
MATNPRIPHDERPEERKEPQLVPNTDQLKPKRPGGGLPGVFAGILVAVVLLAVAIYFLPRMPKNRPPAAAAQIPAQPVPGELQLQGMQLIAGPTDSAYYLDGNVTNTGPHSITGIVAEVKLRSSQNKVILDVQRPLQGMAMHGHNLVSDPLSKNPIKPNDTRPVRLGLDNVPSDWNHNLPDIRIVTVTAEGQ